MMGATVVRSGKISLASFRRSGGVRPQNRPFGSVPKRRAYLIVCEGQETEPNYFKSIAACLPRNMVENVEVEGAGGSPDYLLKVARRKIEERRELGLPPFYHVWLVFDRDKFEHFMDTICAVDDVNRRNLAMKRGERPVEHWHCAWSNEAFELWYVLHFREQVGGGVSRELYQSMIEADVRAWTNDPRYRYEKHDPNMFRRLYPLTIEAIRRAERCLEKQVSEHGQRWDLMNPATCVHLLVRDLLAYMRKGQD